MHKLLARLPLLICALALCGFGSCGRAVRPDPPAQCPTLPPVPASVMQKPATEQKLRDELFESGPRQTPSSAPAKPSSKTTGG